MGRRAAGAREGRRELMPLGRRRISRAFRQNMMLDVVGGVASVLNVTLIKLSKLFISKSLYENECCIFSSSLCAIRWRE